MTPHKPAPKIELPPPGPVDRVRSAYGFAISVGLGCAWIIIAPKVLAPYRCALLDSVLFTVEIIVAGLLALVAGGWINLRLFARAFPWFATFNLATLFVLIWPGVTPIVRLLDIALDHAPSVWIEARVLRPHRKVSWSRYGRSHSYFAGIDVALEDSTHEELFIDRTALPGGQTDALWAPRLRLRLHPGRLGVRWVDNVAFLPAK